ncbi:MAG: UDP-3-O-acyl-N-acetylglucosamine deacetylase, partial [Verrucomicrobiae bacterium]|nr:UDP-3-O-acyl-N-acetylglucosamine deacetylase [Verrucomicrobiae bacterium]
MFEFQQTLKDSVEVTGTSLHTGENTSVVFRPAPANHGVRFQRVDLPGQPIVPALVEHVQSTDRGTTIAENDVVVHTVEHVMSSLAGLGIDNALIQIRGSEPPIFDG